MVFLENNVCIPLEKSMEVLMRIKRIAGESLDTYTKGIVKGEFRRWLTPLSQDMLECHQRIVKNLRPILVEAGIMDPLKEEKLTRTSAPSDEDFMKECQEGNLRRRMNA